MNERRETTPAAPQAWVLRARSLLDESAQQLDGATLSRLNRSRQGALGQLTTPRRGFDLWRALGLGAVAAGLALVLWRGSPLTESVDGRTAQPAVAVVADPTAVPVAAPDFELLVDQESFAVIEDLEFYAWLQAEDRQGG